MVDELDLVRRAYNAEPARTGAAQRAAIRQKVLAEIASEPWLKSTGLGPVISPVTCVSTDFCAVLSVKSGMPELDKTRNGGRTWRSVPAPTGLSSDYQVTGGKVVFIGPIDMSCPTAGDCVVVASSAANLASPSSQDFASPQDVAVGTAYITRNGGLRWTTSWMPPGSAMQVKCFANGRCVSAGESVPAYSSDGGLTWSATGTGDYSGQPALSCSDALDCTLVTSAIPGPGLPAVVVTSNGGRSWPTVLADGLPQDKAFSSISCPSASECWVAGDGIFRHSAGNKTIVGFPAVGGALYLSTNRGETWRDANLPKGVNTIWALSCPSPNACFALASEAPVTSPSAPPAMPTSFVLLAYGASS